MGDVGVQLGPPVGVAQRTVLVEPASALIAEAAPQVVLRATIVTAIGQLARRHRHEETLGAFNDLQIANDEHVVKRDTAEGLQSFIAARVVFHELDADFGDLHSLYSFTWRSLLCSAQGPQVTTRTHPSPSGSRISAAWLAAAELRHSPK